MSDSRAVALAVHAMGCRFELVLAGGEERWLRAAGEEAVEEILAAHASLTRFERGSVVSLLNEGQRVRLDDDLFDLFALSESVRVASLGAFDIRRHGKGEFALDPNCRIAMASPGTTVDLGGIAKGYAIDRAMAVLHDAGVPSAFVHGGSSSAGSVGTQPSGGAWRISLHGPEGYSPVALDLTDRCMSVSSDEHQAEHLIDPRTGEPCGPGVMAACLGDSAAECDAWATALSVLGYRPASAPTALATYIPSHNGSAREETSCGWRIEPAAETNEEHRRLTTCHLSTAERS